MDSGKKKAKGQLVLVYVEDESLPAPCCESLSVEISMRG